MPSLYCYTASGYHYQINVPSDRRLPALLEKSRKYQNDVSTKLSEQVLEARKFKAQRSLRDVELTVNLWVRNPDGLEVEEEEK